MVGVVCESVESWDFISWVGEDVVGIEKVGVGNWFGNFWFMEILFFYCFCLCRFGDISWFWELGMWEVIDIWWVRRLFFEEDCFFFVGFEFGSERFNEVGGLVIFDVFEGFEVGGVKILLGLNEEKVEEWGIGWKIWGVCMKVVDSFWGDLFLICRCFILWEFIFYLFLFCIFLLEDIFLLLCFCLLVMFELLLLYVFKCLVW